MNNKTVVKFNNHDWYIIADDSTATGGTVTLLAADTSFGKSKFHDSSNAYSNSTVKGVLDALTAEGGAFAGVKDAIVDTDLTDITPNVMGAKLYLLSTSEADPYKNLEFTGADYGGWWLRSPDEYNDDSAFLVLGRDVDLDACIVEEEFGVRHALKLNLSSVIFSSVNLSGGANATASGGTVKQNYFDYGSTRNAMTSVTYTASEGYMFPATSDYYTTTNGITVTRTNDTVVTVSGTPTDVANVTVSDAVLAHTHAFTYAAGTDDKANTITASCGEGCDITTGLTLTISAPTGDLTADGTTTFPATLSTGYRKDGTVYRHGFDKKTLGSGEWQYSAWFSAPAACYVIEKPMEGYQIRYENAGVYEQVTDRCCDGGTIIIYKVPKTGDTANLALWMSMVVIGALTLCGVAVISKRRQQSQK